MNKEECETCIKRKTMYCPNSSECLNTKDKLYYQNKIMALEDNEKLVLKNKHLKERIDKAQEEIIKLRDEIIDNLHNINIKEITEDYLYLEQISCLGLKKIFEILGDSNE